MKDLVQEIGHEGEKISRGFDMLREDDSMDDFDIDNHYSSESDNELSYLEMHFLDKHYNLDTKKRYCEHSRCNYIRK